MKSIEPKYKVQVTHFKYKAAENWYRVTILNFYSIHYETSLNIIGLLGDSLLPYITMAFSE